METTEEMPGLWVTKRRELLSPTKIQVHLQPALKQALKYPGGIIVYIIVLIILCLL